MSDVYQWHGNSGSFDDGNNWDNITAEKDPAGNPPGASDFAILGTQNGSATVSGDGTVGTLEIEDNITVTGALTADSVSFLFTSSAVATVSGGTLNGTSILSIDSGSVSVVDGGELDADGLLDYGTLTVNTGSISATELGIGAALLLTSAEVTATEVSVGANPGTQSTLDIAGSSVSDSSGLVGLISGDQSSVGVDAGGSWKNSTELTIGSGGTATLDITAGGSVSAGGGSGTALSVAPASGVTGVVTVDGGGSFLDVSGDADFGGQSGQAQVTLSAGGSLNVSGTLTAGTADICVDGGTLTIGQGLTMDEVASTLEIMGGGVVAGPGPSGTMTVLGSIDINSGTLSGTTLDTGGTVSMQDGTINVQDLGLGTGNGGVTTYTFLNSDAELNVGYATLGPMTDDSAEVAVFSGAEFQIGINLFVGDAGSGEVDVEGGTVAVNGGVGEGNAALDLGVLNAAALGTIALDGAGSSMTVTGAADLGDAGAGNLLLGSGVTFTVAAGLYEGVQSSSGGNLQDISSSNLFSVGGDWVIGDAGGHVDTISGGAIMTVGGALTIARGGGTGSLTITGSGSQVNVTGDATVGLSGSGTLQIEAGGSLSAGGAFSVTSGSTDIGSGAQVTATSGMIAAGGSLSLSGGTLSVGDLTVEGNVSGNGSIASATTVDGTLTANGALIIQGMVGGTGALSIQSGTLELQAGVAAGATIDFNAGTLLLDAPGAADATLQNFGAGDSIVLHGVVANSGSFTNGTLLVQEDGATQVALALAGGYGSGNFRVTPLGNQTTISYVACFAAGTRIATPGGPAAVEALRVGDRVRAAFAGSAPVVWLGHRRLDCRRHPRPHDVLPVRVRANAFGRGEPAADLLLSPDHAVFFEGLLIPIRYLINGATVLQEAAEYVTYWHVELERHDVLFAEGLPAESYLDTGNRGAFANAGVAAQLHPDFGQHIWNTKSCAPLVLDGPRLVGAKQHLLHRAGSLGFAATDDPGLTVVADRQVLLAQTDGRRWQLRLPAATHAVRLISRVWTPAQMRADESDTRALGVAVSRMWLDRREVNLASAGVARGWHAPEPGWRWTNGHAELVPAGARELTFELAMTGIYWRHEELGNVRVA